jgi:hypothetical protein
MVHNHIRIFNDVLPANTCAKLCEYARGEHDFQMDRFDLDNCPKFWKGFFLPEVNQELHDHLIDHVKDCTVKYFKQIKYDLSLLPGSWSLEALTLKRYDPGDRFDRHVDVTNHDTARRWLALQFYLNEDFKGGKTVFEGGPTIQPKTGRLLVFPPTWEYPYTGTPIQSGQKYLLTTYLHYKND